MIRQTLLEAARQNGPSDPDGQQTTRRDRASRTEQHEYPITLSLPAWIYVIVVMIAGLGIGAIILRQATLASIQTPVFAVLLLLAGLSQLFHIDGPNFEIFHPTPIVFVAGIFLLPPPCLVLLILVAHALEWAKDKWRGNRKMRLWVAQPFNTGMYIFAALAAQMVHRWCTNDGAVPDSVVVVSAVLLTFTLANELLLGYMLLVVRGIGWRTSRALTSGLGIELVLASLGYGVALQWTHNPWLIAIGLTPIVLIYRALSIPKLQAENMSSLQQVNAELSEANLSIHHQNEDLFLTLAKIFDARDPYVGGHAAQVAAYALAIAEELELPQERQEIMRQAAYLHDIGKMAIPETILHKPGKLTDEEFDIIKTHSVLGAEFLETSHGLRHLAPFVRYHHERWDGRGYPECLCADTIPLEARILNVCDSVEAMASDRPYHKGMTVEAIITEVQRCAGTQFDPSIAAIFVRIAERNGQHFIINSARAVDQRAADPGTAAVFNSGTVFARLYQQAADSGTGK